MKEREPVTEPNKEVQTGQPTIKRRRVTRACDFCHKRGLKCKPADAATPSSSCQTCIEYHSECTHMRIVAKRGKKPVRPSTVSVEFNRHNIPVQTVSQESQSGENWPLRIQEQKLGQRFQLSVLIDVYFDTVYSIFPFFDEDVFRNQWSDPKFPHDRASYASLMAMLALSARHVEDNALFTPVIRLIEQPEMASSEKFFTEAVQTIPSSFTDVIQFDCIRAAALLALCAIQSRRPSLVQQYLGLYHAFAAQNGLHDETRWPADLDAAERQIRRHFVWSMYRVEVDNAYSIRHIIGSPASQILVSYPLALQVDREPDSGYAENWVFGWNIVTDLYRVLELSYIQNRAKISPISSIECTQDQVSVPGCLATISEKIPARFKHIVDDPGSSNEIKCNIQTSSIIRTIQLVKVASCIGSEVAFDIGHEAMHALAKLPTAHLRAVGSPLLQQIAEISGLLAESCKSQLCNAQSVKLQQTLISITKVLIEFKFREENKQALLIHLRNLEQSESTMTTNKQTLFLTILQELQNLSQPYDPRIS